MARSHRCGLLYPSLRNCSNLLRQPVAIGMILTPSRQLNLPDDPLEAQFEERAIMDFEQRSETWMRKSGSIPIRFANVSSDRVSISAGRAYSRRAQATYLKYLNGLA
jgi:hypothetical protein